MKEKNTKKHSLSFNQAYMFKHHHYIVYRRLANTWISTPPPSIIMQDEMRALFFYQGLLFCKTVYIIIRSLWEAVTKALSSRWRGCRSSLPSQRGFFQRDKELLLCKLASVFHGRGRVLVYSLAVPLCAPCHSLGVTVVWASVSLSPSPLVPGSLTAFCVLNHPPVVNCHPLLAYMSAPLVSLCRIVSAVSRLWVVCSLIFPSLQVPYVFFAWRNGGTIQLGSGFISIKWLEREFNKLSSHKKWPV